MLPFLFLIMNTSPSVSQGLYYHYHYYFFFYRTRSVSRYEENPVYLSKEPSFGDLSLCCRVHWWILQWDLAKGRTSLVSGYAFLLYCYHFWKLISDSSWDFLIVIVLGFTEQPMLLINIHTNHHHLHTLAFNTILHALRENKDKIKKIKE